MNKIKILDCTLRDGGYYTHWDFDKKLVEEYAKSIEQLPVDYVEVGYRSITLNGYLGKYFYCPIYVLEELKQWMPSKKLVVILNEKDIRPEHVEELLEPCIPYITLVRIAIDPGNMVRAILLAKEVKKLGFEVGFNVMYMSDWKKDDSFLNLLDGLENTIDYFYMVDSYGGVMPKDIIDIIRTVRSKIKIPIGFHGHNNLEMALANTITAMQEGCAIVDATITGMGRGAGNLKTELLLTYLEREGKIEVSFDNLSATVNSFENLKLDYNWGTSLPYMFSGAHSLPQKQVMEWVGLNRYPLGSILNALNNQKIAIEDNIKLPVFENVSKFKSALVLGGGPTSQIHQDAIKKILELHKDEFCLIHAGVRNIINYTTINNLQYYGLVGFEPQDVFQVIDSNQIDSKYFVYPPFPRKMGVSIPDNITAQAYELAELQFTEVDTDSPMAIAIQTALNLGVDDIYFIGFDGYDVNINQNQFVIANENQKIINDLIAYKKHLNICSLTPTKYENLKLNSIYSLI
ncbi:aldolase catalytic domain-containing protein [Leeuwenhoekiella nanhaiensis]|uniref:Pyruvate carboxyltransferase domain-containing protein n=1 Tax=Leeuwenhoekiella nanhaiensis TaxID=1655491 RepID=A0A2G1VP84_9FLAO|nr:aldolase catalytic domain-containing protein [Leeuwenhoekiella nanhaiensis]PHQ28289.1 hypothetical protein CJ305_15750 [Leeuwenhoekiella nanhaiensis]